MRTIILIVTWISCTLLVQDAQGQYYLKRILKDHLKNGDVKSLMPIGDDKIVLQMEILYPFANSYSDIIAVESMIKGTEVIKDFYPPDQWMFIIGRALKYQNHRYYYSSRDIIIEDKAPEDIGWNYGVLDEKGRQITHTKITIAPINGLVAKCHGLELVKNEEVIMWGESRHPNKDPNVNDPYITWVRLHKDGTVLSGPFYYKPPGVKTWAIPTDATIDIDSNIVIAYDSKNFDNQTYVLKIRPDDTVEQMVKMELVKSSADDNARMEVTRDGHFIIRNYDEVHPKVPALVKVDRNNRVVWKSAFEVPVASLQGPPGPKVTRFGTKRIVEISNGDLLMCGLNFQIDSFYSKNLGKNILKGNYRASFMARFSSNGDVKWVHFLADPDDNGKLNHIDLNDIVELSDGSIMVAGELGNKYESNTTRPFIMKLGPNGCFDPVCSHVDKWWFFPEDVFSSTETTTADADYHLHIYPNPGSEKVGVSLRNGEFGGTNIRYAIRTMSGQTAMLGVLESHEATIDTQFLSDGVYIISVQDARGKIWNAKWVKQ